MPLFEWQIANGKSLQKQNCKTLGPIEDVHIGPVPFPFLGQFPDKFDKLAPRYLDAIPADPFNGKSLNLTVGKNRWIIYSVGPDGVDDGGVEWNAKAQKGDVIFTLRAAAAR